MLGLAAGQALAAARAHPGAESPPPPPGRGDGGTGRRVLGLIALLVAYPLAAGSLGFLVASFAFVLGSSRLLGARDWLRPAALALGVTVAAYLLFVAWLGVPLPSGPLR